MARVHTNLGFEYQYFFFFKLIILKNAGIQIPALTNPDESKCSTIHKRQEVLKTSKLHYFCGSCVVWRNSICKYLFTWFSFFILECITYLLQKNWWKSKFGNSTLVFGSACLEKTVQPISHTAISFLDVIVVYYK